MYCMQQSLHELCDIDIILIQNKVYAQVSKDINM